MVNALPGIRKASGDFAGLSFTRPPVTIERADVEAYAAVCGFPNKDTVPLPYPHMLAFGLQMAIMSDSAFPAPAIGTVHLENSITQHRPIAVGETLAVTASVGTAVPHPKGTVYEFVTEVRAGDELVWEEVSAYLRRGRGNDAASYGMVFPEVVTTGTTWRLPADLGRTYASVSGDHNPIHLYPITAKALGFPRQIAHGMWTLARSPQRSRTGFRPPSASTSRSEAGAAAGHGRVRLDPGRPGLRVLAHQPEVGEPLTWPAGLPLSDEALLGHGRHEGAVGRVDVPKGSPRAPLAEGDHWS